MSGHRHKTDRVDGLIIAECPNIEHPDDDHSERAITDGGEPSEARRASSGRRPDGGRPIEELAAEDGFEPGGTPNGTKTHLVDFNSRSPLVQGTSGATDKLLCGRVGSYDRVEPPEDGHEWCDTCLDRFLGYRLGLADEPAMVAGGPR